MTITNTSRALESLFSIANFLDKFLMKRHQRRNKIVFIANGFMLKISFNMPAKALNTRANLNSNNKLTITMLINSKSGKT